MFIKSSPNPTNNQLSSSFPKEQATSSSFSKGKVGVTNSNQITEYFSFKLQKRISETDPTIAWQYNVPILNPNEKQLFLCTESFATVLQGYIGNDFPQTISIGLIGYSGFIGFEGTSSNKIIVLNLAQTNVYVENGIVARDLIYKSETQAMWPMGTLRNIQFSVYVDEQVEPINFPTQNALAISFKIVHLAI